MATLTIERSQDTAARLECESRRRGMDLQSGPSSWTRRPPTPAAGIGETDPMSVRSARPGARGDSMCRVMECEGQVRQGISPLRRKSLTRGLLPAPGTDHPPPSQAHWLSDVVLHRVPPDRRQPGGFGWCDGPPSLGTAAALPAVGSSPSAYSTACSSVIVLPSAIASARASEVNAKRVASRARS